MGWTIKVHFLAWAGMSSLHHHMQTSSGAHPASQPIGTVLSSHGDKAAGA